jgi:hypothetical protein
MTEKPMPSKGDNFRLIGPVAREVVEDLTKKRRGKDDAKPSKQPKR